MSAVAPRLRMFAGPNGSGKSTLKSVLLPELLGVYLNPDEIEAVIKATGRLHLADYGVEATSDEILSFFRTAPLLVKNGLQPEVARLTFHHGSLSFPAIAVNSYWASVAADFLRQKLIGLKASFTVETVMSHPGKIELLRSAQSAGYRTYLYYIATDDPQINISRVRNRVMRGGHSVPENKIVERYHRSLSLLSEAVRATNRAYIFDNSGDQGTHTWLAEITDGKTLELKVNSAPAWFKKALLPAFKIE